MQHDLLYPTDLLDAQWQQIEPWIPAHKSGGRPPKHSLRSIVNGLFYIVQAGCAWRLLPKTFPPWSTLYGYFWRWNRAGLWEKIHDRLRALVRQAAGHDPQPTAAVLDSQSVKTSECGGERGYDGAKKLVGRKRHLLVDTLGLLLFVLITPADEPDRDMAWPLLAQALNRFRRVRRVWADAAYAGELLPWVRQRWRGRAEVQIVRRSQAAPGFQVQPKRWIVERTFGWLVKARRLVRDYERNTTHSEAFLHLRMSQLMLRRLHPKNT